MTENTIPEIPQAVREFAAGLAGAGAAATTDVSFELLHPLDAIVSITSAKIHRFIVFSLTSRTRTRTSTTAIVLDAER